MTQYPHWITITITMGWKLVSVLIQTESICYRLHKSKRIPCVCVSKAVVAFVNINSVTLFVGVWFACAFIAYGVYLYVCLVESLCLNRKHTPKSHKCT